MKKFIHYFLFCSALIFQTSLSAQVQIESISKSERALVALVNLSNGADPKKIVTQFHLNEDRVAYNLIINKTEDHYAKIKVLFREETTADNFISAIKEMADDPAIKAIDTIIYTHGQAEESGDDDAIKSLGLWSQDRKYISTAVLSSQVKAVAKNKLRMLYSDACWSQYHNQHWLDAGYVVSAGSKEVDANRALDLRRFLKKWRKGEPFGKAISFANRHVLTKVMDLIIGGVSEKIAVGDMHLTINSGFNRIHHEGAEMQILVRSSKSETDLQTDAAP